MRRTRQTRLQQQKHPSRPRNFTTKCTCWCAACGFCCGSAHLKTTQKRELAEGNTFPSWMVIGAMIFGKQRTHPTIGAALFGHKLPTEGVLELGSYPTSLHNTMYHQYGVFTAPFVQHPAHRTVHQTAPSFFLKSPVFG